MTTTFENARIGDRVWCIRSGWGVVKDICPHLYSLIIKYENGKIGTYTAEGFYSKDDVQQSLFWDVVKFEAPVKPLPSLEVDTRVIVWNSPSIKFKRHFSHFSPSGNIVCFANRMTSLSTEHTSEWDHWELAE